VTAPNGRPTDFTRTATFLSSNPSCAPQSTSSGGTRDSRPTAYSFAADPGRRVTAVRAEHVRQLRAALEGALTRLGLPSGGYAHPALYENSSLIYAADFQELREQVRGAWRGDAGGVDIRWVVTDQLGTPRMAADRAGSLAGVTRHDYLPFGEEVPGDPNGRTPERGYRGDTVRQKFTGYEHDGETGLDYAKARYFASTQGRFTSADPLTGSAQPALPQSWNRYTYSLNSPMKFVDPTGTRWAQMDCQGGKSTCYDWFDDKAKGKDGLTAYDRALKTGGYSAVTFDESKPFEYVYKAMSEMNLVARLNTDGTSELLNVPRSEPNPGVDMMRGQAFDIAFGQATGGLIARGIGAVFGRVFARGAAEAAEGIATPYGAAVQSLNPEALAAREAVENGAMLYRGGVLGRSAGPEGQFWSFESPLNPGYAQRFGIPAENMNFDFVEYGTLKPGSPVITRPAPGMGANGGGGIEAVVNPHSVILRGFHTP
jgi:RHS repeat-associated protein